MRFLHTSDWHLGKTAQGRDFLAESARVLDEVVRIARDERIDVMLIAGDTFDSFAPGSDAHALFYETLASIVSEGAKVVMIAGNHDDAAQMDALGGIMRRLGVHFVGAVPEFAAESIIRLPSRDGGETAAIAALPWVQERYALRFETLLEGIDKTRRQYREVMEKTVVPSCFKHFPEGAVNIVLGHMLIDGSEIGEGGGERKIHIGQAFAVNASCIPDTASYVALGHVHKRQQIAAGSPTQYCGSLLQLDFGEAEQKKYVNIIEASARAPADVRAVEVTGGRGLRTVRCRIDELASHAGEYGDDYLRVIVSADAPVPSLVEQVRDALPNALKIELERTDEPAAIEATTYRGLTPHELLGRYYTTKNNAEIPEPMLKLFGELYEAEAAHAPA
jgi:exonuclease SbcD